MSPRLRLVLVLVLAAFAGAAAFVALSPAREETPEGVFDYVRRRTLDGDGDALYRMMTPRARGLHAGMVDNFRKGPDSEGARTFREKLGLSREDVARLTPDSLLARECLVMLKPQLDGARVLSAKPLVRAGEKTESPDEVILEIYLRELGTIRWQMKRVDRAWRIDNAQPVVNMRGELLQ